MGPPGSPKGGTRSYTWYLWETKSGCLILEPESRTPNQGVRPRGAVNGISGSLNLGVWNWKTKHFARDVLQKSTFAEIGFLMILGSNFHDFGLGPIFMTFVAMESGLKFNDFWG